MKSILWNFLWTNSVHYASDNIEQSAVKLRPKGQRSPSSDRISERGCAAKQDDRHENHGNQLVTTNLLTERRVLITDTIQRMD